MSTLPGATQIQPEDFIGPPLPPQTVEVKAGDSLATIAYEIFGDSSLWRELAFFNKLDNFEELKVGSFIEIPYKEKVEQILALEDTQIDEFTDKVELRIKQIVNSREVQFLTKLLGVDTTTLLADLDLSPIADKLKATVNTVNEWQLIQWII